MAVDSRRSSGRISRLRMESASLPSVENTLDDFIARANELPASEQARFDDKKQPAEEVAQREPPLAIGSEPFERTEREAIEERVRVAEAKAAKAIAAARAASAGLSISPNDIAAIESGLVVPATPRKAPSWRLVVASLVLGACGAFAAAFLLLGHHDAASKVAAPADPSARVDAMQHTPAPALAKPPSAPIVTPIEEPDVRSPTPVEAKSAPVDAKPAPLATKLAPADAEPRETKPAPKKRKAREPSNADQAPSGGLVDPF